MNKRIMLYFRNFKKYIVYVNKICYNINKTLCKIVNYMFFIIRNYVRWL